MKKAKIYCPDIECDSCVKFLDNTLKDVKGLKDFKVNKDNIDVEYDKPATAQKIAEFITENGYRAGLKPFPRKSFKERFRDFIENKDKYQVEYTMLKYSLMTFLALVFVQAIVYLFFFSNDSMFLQKHGIWIFYLDVAIVSIGSAMWHVQSYRVEMGMMAGMMIGMTFGMQTGLMIGTIIGATNGMFVGTMVGMLTAIFVGWYNGRHSGIMGVLEGVMAGLMNGSMGAMTAVMLYSDHLLWYMPFFMAFNLIIMWGLSYMLFEEVVENNSKIAKRPVSFVKMVVYSAIVSIVVIAIMIYGPKSGLAALV